MKTVLPIIILMILTSTVAFSQAAINRNNISSTLVEAYEFSRSNKKQKHGTYVVMNDQNMVVLEGTYDMGRKSGQWKFYSDSGKLVQKYDFNEDKLMYQAYDTASIIQVGYKLEQPASPSAVVEAPTKIGGSNYGFFLLYDSKFVPKEVLDQKGEVVMVYELGISETGKLESWNIHFNGPFVKKSTRQSLRGLPAEAYEHIAAKVDGQPVRSSLLYAVKLNINETKITRLNDVVTY